MAQISEEPEWLERDEPVRVAIGDLKFEAAEGEPQVNPRNCLARAVTGDYKARSSLSSDGYGGERALADGTVEKFIGCRGCHALCTVVADEGDEIISVAEAPDPNPWLIQGSFNSCRTGSLRVPEGGEALVKPLEEHGRQHLLA